MSGSVVCRVSVGAIIEGTMTLPQPRPGWESQPPKVSQEHQGWVLSDTGLLDGVMVLQHDLLLKLGQFVSILSPFPREKIKGLAVP